MASQTGTAQIKISTFNEPLPASAHEPLRLALPAYVQGQRWFRAKARRISEITVVDSIPLNINASSALIILVRYTEGDPDTYFLPVTIGVRDDVPAQDVIAPLTTLAGEAGVLYNALIDAEFRTSLLEAIGCDEEFAGQTGSLVTVRTNAFDRQCRQWVPELESKVSRAEQSNTSIIFGDRYILKIFRKLESGMNPDIEIGRFLTEQNFANSPAVLGGIEYRKNDGDVMHAGILMQFVTNRGDAWKYTLDSLAEFFPRVLKTDVPTLPSFHPFELLDITLEEPERMIGAYAASARLLGERTAQMHAALSANDQNPDFAPEPFTPEYAAVVKREMEHEADRAFGLLKAKSHAASSEAAQMLKKEAAIRARLNIIGERPIEALRIRHHGDYHLGQVLYTGQDFVIIDFEGEPARDLAARRAKTLAMRDVAGMVRSFSYAAYAALFGQVEGVRADAENRSAVERWAAHWSAMASAEFLRAYLNTAQGSKFAGSNRDEQRELFDAFVLQKALYEVAYELNNRPDWVQIPLHGILTLID